MNTARKLVNIGTITAFCRYLKRGVARNRLSGELYNLIKCHKSKYAFMVPSFKKNEIKLEGGVTWGDSGCSFSIRVSSKADDVRLLLKPHRNCSLSEAELEKIVFQLLDDMRAKLVNEMPVRREIPKYPMLLACAKTRRYSQKSIDNVNYYIDRGVFDKEFGNAVNAQHKNGMRCNKKAEGMSKAKYSNKQL